jgi:crotonobetainyl-CoA:carnitine CoA-transferase CaiB-like acyl-CoA transferase
MYLGALGADVVKVESLRRPDMMRFGGSTRTGDEAWEWSIVYGGANNSKRDVPLDLGVEPGASLVRQLVQWADVVIENMSPRVLDGFGLGWDELHATNPRAVMVRMPAFGLDGPWRDRTGWAMTVEQTSGLAWVTGYDEQPLVPRGPCDPVGGMHAVFATLLALIDRERTGEGVLVEVPLVETALNVAGEQIIEWSAHRVLLGREGNRGPAAASQGVYACAGEDTWVAVAVTDDAQWVALCALIGFDAGAIPQDVERRTAPDTIDTAITNWTRRHTAAQAEQLLTEVGVPASELVNPRAVLPHPQLEHRRFLQYFDHPVTGKTGYAAFPMVFSAWGPHLHRSAPPTFGEHNDEVLESVLGLSADEVSALRAAGAVGERPLGV